MRPAARPATLPQAGYAQPQRLFVSATEVRVRAFPENGKPPHEIDLTALPVARPLQEWLAEATGPSGPLRSADSQRNVRFVLGRFTRYLARSTDRQAEHEAITAAIHRMLAGRPQRSTGALTVLQLAVEAGVKRWVLTHKHQDLKAEFEQRRARANGIPSAFQTVAAQVNDLGQATQRLRAENAELRQRVDAYAQVIYQLSAELHLLQATQPQNKVRPLRQRPS